MNKRSKTSVAIKDQKPETESADYHYAEVYWKESFLFHTVSNWIAYLFVPKVSS